MLYMHISHTNSGRPDNVVPLFDWGKYFERDGEIRMPFSVQAHHSFVDGLHVGRFLECMKNIWILMIQSKNKTKQMKNAREN